MLETKAIHDIVAALEPKLVEERRHFHVHAEISGQEVETAAYVAAEMSKLGMEPRWLKEPVAAWYLLDTGRPGKTLALRADMDALAMPEEDCNLKGPKAAVSQNEGACHACGHDGHTAMLLSVARALAENKDKLNGRVIFIFESGEEASPSSYPLFVEMLKAEKPDAIWGMHVYAFMDSGTISAQAGPRMASAGSFNIKIIGRGGHGSRPDQSINPVVTASEIVAKLNSVIPLDIPADEAGVLAVTSIQGGETWNIIPDTCTIRGNIRYFSIQNYERIVQGIRRVVDGLCAANNCRAEYVSMPEKGHPVVNDPAVSKMAAAAIEKVWPGSLVEEPAWMASETFGAYQEVVPGVFVFLGTRNEELGSGAAHHNVKFDLDERTLSLGVGATLQFVSDFLG